MPNDSLYNKLKVELALNAPSFALKEREYHENALAIYLMNAWWRVVSDMLYYGGGGDQGLVSQTPVPLHHLLMLG